MNYALTDDAEADLRGIVRYTRKEWSAAQARTYVAKLKAGIARVAAEQGGFKELGSLSGAAHGPLRTSLRILPAA